MLWMISSSLPLYDNRILVASGPIASLLWSTSRKIFSPIWPERLICSCCSMSRVGKRLGLARRSFGVNLLLRELSPEIEMCSRPEILMFVFSPRPMIFSRVRGSLIGIVRLISPSWRPAAPPTPRSSISRRLRYWRTA